MKKLGVAIYGAGWVSSEHIRAYQKNPHTEIVALGSRRLESAEARAKEMGLTDIALTDNYEELLKTPGVDIVSLCTPPHCHPEQTILAARAGKHLVIEKAVANDLPSLRAMQTAVQEAGVKTVVSFVLRWNPQFVWIDKMLNNQTLGSLFYVEVDYWHNIGPQYAQYAWNVKKEVAGSVFLSAGCHAVDALRFFARDEVVEVMAYANQRNREYEYPTNVVGIVKFAGGAIGKVSASFDVTSPYAFNIDILGEKGTIRDNHIYAKEAFPGVLDWITVPTVRPDSGDVSHHPFQGEINHFVDCILTDTESFVNLADAAKTHEVCFALDKSVEIGQPVRIADLG